MPEQIPAKQAHHDAVYGPLSVDVNIEETSKKPKDSVVLLLSAFGACLIVVGVGVSIVWTSPILWKLRSNLTDINPLGTPITTPQVALVAGLNPLGGFLGPLYLTKFCDIIGRKKTLMVLSAVMLACNVCMAFATHIYVYYVGRFATGLCIGAAVAAVSIFLSEISEDHNRGTIGCMLGVCFPLGNLYVYVLGPMVSVKNFNLLCAIPLVVNLVCFMTFIPESPVYLASKGKKEDAIEALERLRRKNPSDIEKEYEKIVLTLKGTSGKGDASWGSMFRVKSLRRGLIIAVGLNLFQQLSGICAILTFAGPLFDAAGATFSGDTTGILIGLVKVIGVFLATVTIESFGRRPLLMISTLGGSLPHFLLGLFFYLKAINSPIVSSILWLPVVSVLLFIITYAIGLGVIPLAMMSELFPSNVKSKAASASTFTALVFIFILTTAFPIMNEALGPSWCLWLFSVCEFFGFLFVYFLVPEIKGKSLTEVQELLSR